MGAKFFKVILGRLVCVRGGLLKFLVAGGGVLKAFLGAAETTGDEIKSPKSSSSPSISAGVASFVKSWFVGFGGVGGEIGVPMLSR